MARFSEDLAALEKHGFNGKVTLGEVERVLEGRGFATLIMVMCLPFIQPIPLPGLSMVFGGAIIVLGARLTLGGAGGLPAFVRTREIDATTLSRLVQGARKISSYVERFFRPRLGVMLSPPLGNIVGISIMASGLALSLPLPPVILFSNALPAWSIICSCLGYLERDGVAIAVGHLLCIASWCYFAIWWDAIAFALERFLY